MVGDSSDLLHLPRCVHSQALYGAVYGAVPSPGKDN